MKQPILTQMLTSQMRYMAQRQTVLAANMANIDTPSYIARDLKKLDFPEVLRGQSGRMPLKATASGKSLTGTLGNDPFAAEKTRKTYEETPSGNNVVLEEQMAKISDTGAQFQIASNLYKKFNSLYNISLGKNA